MNVLPRHAFLASVSPPAYSVIRFDPRPPRLVLASSPFDSRFEFPFAASHPSAGGVHALLSSSVANPFLSNQVLLPAETISATILHGPDNSRREMRLLLHPSRTRQPPGSRGRGRAPSSPKEVAWRTLLHTYDRQPVEFRKKGM